LVALSCPAFAGAAFSRSAFPGPAPSEFCCSPHPPHFCSQTASAAAYFRSGGPCVPESAWEDRLRSALAGTYTFERELGGGGMSRVFVATESSLGRQVVIKVLPPQLAEGASTERVYWPSRATRRSSTAHCADIRRSRRWLRRSVRSRAACRSTTFRPIPPFDAAAAVPTPATATLHTRMQQRQSL
jgi:hypothetical protein